MFIPLDPTRGLSEQIYEFLRQEIEVGALSPGQKLLSSRALAESLEVSRNTVLGAYDRLTSEGYLESRGPGGTVVSTLASTPQARGRRRDNAAPNERESAREKASRPRSGGGDTTPNTKVRRVRLSHYGRRAASRGSVFSPYSWQTRLVPFDFRHNVLIVDQQSDRLWSRIARQLLRSEMSPNYQTTQDPGLRRELVENLRNARGVHCRPEQIMIVAGPQAAFHLIGQILLDRGDIVAMEEAHYLGIRNTARVFGARVQGIKIDNHGMRVDHLERRDPRAKLVYVAPSHQWPSGAILPYARRRALLDWADRRGAYIIENDHNVEYRVGGRPTESLQSLDRSDRVFYVGTFLRVRSRGLRVGFVVVPEHLVGICEAAGALAGIYPATSEQAILAEFIRLGYLDQVNRRVRKRASLQRTALSRAIRREFAEELASDLELFVPRSGFHVHTRWKQFPTTRTDELLEKLLSAGVRVYPESPFYLRSRRQAGLLFGVGNLDPAEIDIGVARFASTLRKLRREHPS